jgi:hypothetical protein
VDCLGEVKETKIANTLHARWKTVYTSHLSQKPFSQYKEDACQPSYKNRSQQVQDGPLIAWSPERFQILSTKIDRFTSKKGTQLVFEGFRGSSDG